MIECIFTLDYEIFGNGEGSLRELVLEPAAKLKRIFDEVDAKLVVFVEAAELEMIAAHRSDTDIDNVERQIRDLHEAGHEIALHIHPQWYNGRRTNGTWQLDYSEYNLCTLPRERISQIVTRAVAYLRRVLDNALFTPTSFRAGNWLFQPTATAAAVLAENGIRVDSSVFKGGVQHKLGLDYRRSLSSGHYWRFSSDVNTPDPHGPLLEIPVFSRMVPFWRMLSAKRMGLKRGGNTAKKTFASKLGRLRDFLRFAQSMKFDFCTMTIDELTDVVENAIKTDRIDTTIFRPMAAIGHTKDLYDIGTVVQLLQFLRNRDVRLSTFRDIYDRCGRPPATRPIKDA